MKLLQDRDAVVTATTLPYSQGEAEGRINKLKLVKRSMYGRGKYDPLRRRVLYASRQRESSQAATRRELELRSSDSRENRPSGVSLVGQRSYRSSSQPPEMPGGIGLLDASLHDLRFLSQVRT